MLGRTLAAEGYAAEAPQDGGAALAAPQRSAPDLGRPDVATPARGGAARAAAAESAPGRDARARARGRLGRSGERDGERRRPLRVIPAPEARRPAVDRDGARRRLLARPAVMRSLRARSVLASATAILLALVVLGAGVDVLVSRHLHRSLDRTLRARAVEIAQLSASAP